MTRWNLDRLGGNSSLFNYCCNVDVPPLFICSDIQRELSNFTRHSLDFYATGIDGWEFLGRRKLRHLSALMTLCKWRHAQFPNYKITAYLGQCKPQTERRWWSFWSALSLIATFRSLSASLRERYGIQFPGSKTCSVVSKTLPLVMAVMHNKITRHEQDSGSASWIPGNARWSCPTCIVTCSTRRSPWLQSQTIDTQRPSASPTMTHATAFVSLETRHKDGSCRGKRWQFAARVGMATLEESSITRVPTCTNTVPRQCQLSAKLCQPRHLDGWEITDPIWSWAMRVMCLITSQASLSRVT